MTSERHIAKAERKPRLKDEAYLYLIAKKLPALGFAPPAASDYGCLGSLCSGSQRGRSQPYSRLARKRRVQQHRNHSRSLCPCRIPFIASLHPHQYREAIDGKKYNPNVHKEYVEPYNVVPNRDKEDSLKEYRKALIEGKPLPVDADVVLDGLLERVYSKRPRVMQNKVMFFFSGARVARQKDFSFKESDRGEPAHYRASSKRPCACSRSGVDPRWPAKKPPRSQKVKLPCVRPVTRLQAGELFPAA